MTRLFGSLLKTCTVLVRLPDLPLTLTAPLILPFSFGLRRPELAIAAVQPQEADTFSITSS